MKVVPQEPKGQLFPAADGRVSTVVSGSDPWESLIADVRDEHEFRPPGSLSFNELRAKLGFGREKARQVVNELLAAGKLRTVGKGGAYVFYLPVKPDVSPRRSRLLRRAKAAR